MDNKGFVPDYYKSVMDLWNISGEMMEWYRDQLGTEVVVTRVKDTHKHKSVLTTTLTSTFEDDTEIEKFNWKLLINMSQMMPLWRRNGGSIEVVDTVRKLKSGDLVKFEYLGVSYEFKVTGTQSYGIGQDICYQYTLTALTEHKI
jgi:hypothetical protein